MDIEVEERGNVMLIKVKGRLDAVTSPQLETKLSAIVDAGHQRLLLSFSGVDYLSSAGMRLLLAISKKLQGLEGKLVVCEVAEGVMEVINMAGFHRILTITDTEAQALEAF